MTLPPAAAPLPAVALRAGLPDRRPFQAERKIKGKSSSSTRKTARADHRAASRKPSNLYKDQITYVPKAVIQEVDPFNKRRSRPHCRRFQVRPQHPDGAAPGWRHGLEGGVPSAAMPKAS
jgi:hypothetical protein